MKIKMNNCNGEIDIHQMLTDVTEAVMNNICGDGFDIDDEDIKQIRKAKSNEVFKTVENENDTDEKCRRLQQLTSIEDCANFIANEVSYIANKNHHYDSNPQLSQLLMHVVSELVEASQAALKNNFATAENLKMIDSENSFNIKYFEQNVKNTVGDEMADVIILLFSIAKYMKIDIAKHIVLKMHYNKVRQKHSVETTSYSKVNNNLASKTSESCTTRQKNTCK